MKIRYSKLFGLVAFMLPGLMWMANSAAGDLSKVDESSSTAHVEETNELLIFLKPGTDPRVFAARQGLEIKYQLLSDPNAYVLTAPSVLNAKQALQNVTNDPDPDTASAYLNLKTRHERAFNVNDPYFIPFSGYRGQWHLYNAFTPGLDARVLSVWNRDITGAGVTIGIIDDSLEKDHVDIQGNYVAADSWDFGQNDSDPSPVNLNDIHGTAVAGVAAAKGGNSKGVTGAAPNAGLAGLRIDFTKQTTAMFVDATLFHSSGGNTNIKVKNHSYANSQPYVPSPAEENALVTSAASGTIHVLSAGDDRGKTGQDANTKDLQNSVAAITVAALGSDGKYASYSSFGANVFVSAPSSSLLVGSVTDFGITTTDRSGEFGYNYTLNPSPTLGFVDKDPFPDWDYTSIFGGTSSAAPLVAGVMALGKQVQPNLDVRFAKHLLVRSSDVIDAGDSTVSSDGGWKTNAAGFHFNQNYGFGQINADQFTQKANEFQAVTPLSTQTTGTVTVNKSIPDNNKNGIVSEFSLSGALPLEEIKIHLNVTHTYVGDLEAYLTSPSGTVSRLMLSSASGADNLDWDFVSNAFWGENPQGTWNLMVRDVALNDTGTWNSFSATANKGTLTSGTLSSISIDDVTQAEGNTGNAIFNFTVSLTPASSGTVTVNYATANGTATAGSDYQSANGTLTFSPGQTTKMVTVNVIGDTTVEPNETFFVNLSGASGAAVISRAQGVGTITNDDQSTQPDFVVTGVTLNPASPCRGRTFKATVTVRNQGGVSASAGYLKVWANQPSVQSCTASANTLSWIGTLAAGASKSITVYLPGQSEGTKTLRAFVDGSCRTAESDETNNQFPLDYNIVALCPPK